MSYQQFLEWKRQMDDASVSEESSSGELHPDLGSTLETEQKSASPGPLEPESASEKVPLDPEPPLQQVEKCTGTGATLTAEDFLSKGGKGKKSTEASKTFHVSTAPFMYVHWMPWYVQLALNSCLISSSIF